MKKRRLKEGEEEEEEEEIEQPAASSLRGLGGVLLEPAGVADCGQGALQHLDVHWSSRWRSGC